MWSAFTQQDTQHRKLFLNALKLSLREWWGPDDHNHVSPPTQKKDAPKKQNELDLLGIEPRTFPMLRENYTTKPQALEMILKTFQHKNYIF